MENPDNEAVSSGVTDTEFFRSVPIDFANLNPNPTPTQKLNDKKKYLATQFKFENLNLNFFENLLF